MVPPTSDLRPPISPVPSRDLRGSQRKAIIRYGIFTVIICAVFWRTLAGIVNLSLRDTLHSHLPLIPFVSAYLLWIRRHTLPRDYRPSPSPVLAVLPFIGGAIAVAAPLLWPVDSSAHLALMTLALLCFLLGGGFLFLGSRWIRAAAFPMAFLFFSVPLPDHVVELLETASKLASAEAADLFFSISGTTYVRDGNTFALPGVTLEVAQECSGIRSSLVLLITGAFAANLLLQTTWRRWILTLIVIPLGILRNGFRILTLGLLAVHVGPHMLDSWIHHQGGPVFFALSMIPLLAILWWLRKGEGKHRPGFLANEKVDPNPAA